MNAHHPWVEASVKIVRSAERIGIPEIKERKSSQSDLINEDDIEEALGINDPEDPIS